MLSRTTAYYRIKRLTNKIKIIQGGMGAGKNYAIAMIILEKAAKERLTITIMTDTYDNLKDGAISDFKNIFEEIGLSWDNHFNKTGKDLRFGKSIIQFRYISDTKSDAGKSKRRDILYLNEANKFGWEVASTYIGRTHRDIYIDYNPDFEFWAHTQVPKLKDKTGNPLSEQIIVTFKDNEMIPESELQYILSRKDNIEWFRVYGLGETGFYSDRLIYRYQFCDAIPDTAKRIPSGMDFGSSPDPTILVNLYVDGWKLYCDEVFCEYNLMPEKIAGAERQSIVDKLEEVHFERGWLIVADSASRVPRMDMIKHGYNVKGAHKTTGSVIQGINRVNGYEIYITPRSVNLKKGFESWFRKVDANGNPVPEPDGHEPDGLAAIRYAVGVNPKTVNY